VGLGIIENLIYGFVSGLTEFFPISSQAHQSLMLKMFGATDAGNLTGLLVHGAVLLALYLNRRDHIDHLRRAQQLYATPKRRRKHQPDHHRLMEFRMLKTAAITMLFGFLLYQQTQSLNQSLIVIAVLWAVNGAVLFAPVFLRRGNKDARSMTGFDSLLMGVSAALGMLPGISRMATVLSSSVVRGADQEHAFNWALLLCIPALAGMLVFDVISIITGGIGALGLFAAIGYALAALGAFIGAHLSLRMMRSFSRRGGFSGFAYYCWGAALFSFIMYLSI
jgi:undecaprenyl-diphosphatase